VVWFRTDGGRERERDRMAVTTGSCGQGGRGNLTGMVGEVWFGHAVGELLPSGAIFVSLGALLRHCGCRDAISLVVTERKFK
jgi:hypothetical protein